MKRKDTSTARATESILDKIDRNDGMTVPDGYFESLTQRIAASLPEQEWERPADEVVTAPRSFWQIIRPYTYLAAMFAGIWCMMHIFSLTQGASQNQLSIDNYPMLAQALADPTLADEFSDELYYDTNEDDLMDTLWQEGFNPAEDFPTE